MGKEQIFRIKYAASDRPKVYPRSMLYGKLFQYRLTVGDAVEFNGELTQRHKEGRALNFGQKSGTVQNPL
jgi:hypothetical protein